MVLRQGGNRIVFTLHIRKDVRIIPLPLSRKPSLQGYSASGPTHHRLPVKPLPRLASCHVHRHMGGLSLQKSNSHSLGVRHELLSTTCVFSSVQQVSEAGPFIIPFYRGGHWGKGKCCPGHSAGSGGIRIQTQAARSQNLPSPKSEHYPLRHYLSIEGMRTPRQPNLPPSPPTHTVNFLFLGSKLKDDINLDILLQLRPKKVTSFYSV